MLLSHLITNRFTFQLSDTLTYIPHTSTMATMTYDDICNAKLVEIQWDHFHVNGEGDCDWVPYRKILRVLDDDGLAALTARRPTVAKHSVAIIEPCDEYPESLMYSMITHITMGYLKPLYMCFKRDGYSNCEGGFIRVREIEILDSY